MKVFSFLVCALLFCVSIAEGQEPGRSLFVSVIENSPVLSSRENIFDLVKFAKASKIETLFVQVYRANQSWFPSQFADQTPYVENLKKVGEDSFALLIKEAHKNGIEVHAWLNLMSLSKNMDAKILQKYGPEILTRNLKPKSTIKDYQIDNQYFLEPGDLRVRQELGSILEELIKTYPQLDGIQFDYIRYPDVEPHYGYSAINVKRFKEATGQSEIVDGSEIWQKWKRDQVTELLTGLTKKAKSLKPDIHISTTGCMMFVRAYYEAFQDWALWVNSGLIEFVTIMSYPPTVAEFQKQIEDARQHVKDFTKVNIAVGAYKCIKTPDIFIRQWEICQEAHGLGCAVFYYGNLLENPLLSKALEGEKSQ
jgi:uncharacterized lipoprotein YddW (UPF0748 family)